MFHLTLYFLIRTFMFLSNDQLQFSVMKIICRERSGNRLRVNTLMHGAQVCARHATSCELLRCRVPLSNSALAALPVEVWPSGTGGSPRGGLALLVRPLGRAQAVVPTLARQAPDAALAVLVILSFVEMALVILSFLEMALVIL